MSVYSSVRCVRTQRFDVEELPEDELLAEVRVLKLSDDDESEEDEDDKSATGNWPRCLEPQSFNK